MNQAEVQSFAKVEHRTENLLGQPPLFLSKQLDTILSGAEEIPLGNLKDTWGKYDLYFDASISYQAIKHIQLFETFDQDILKASLYGYGRVPVTPSLRRFLPGPQSVFSFLGINKLPDEFFECVNVYSPKSKSEYWFHFSPKIIRKNKSATSSYKLYICPKREFVPKCFSALVELVLEGNIKNFKTFSTAYGICRPDKIVVYFDHRSELEKVATKLVGVLGTMPPQPVPFSTPITQSGLLSWGIDPDRDLFGVASWRTFVTDLIIDGLLSIRKNKLLRGEEDWKKIFWKLEHLGIDPKTWRAPEWLLSNGGESEF